MTEPVETSPLRTITEISNEHTLLVGAYIILWNHTELHFQTYVLALTGWGLQTISTIMSSPNVPTNMGVFKAIVLEKLKADEVAEFAATANSCADKLMSLSNFRNEVAHGKWIVDMSRPQSAINDEGQKVTFGSLVSSKTPFSFGSRQVSVSDLQTELGKLDKLGMKVRDLSWRYQTYLNPEAYKLPSPWHGKF